MIAQIEFFPVNNPEGVFALHLIDPSLSRARAFCAKTRPKALFLSLCYTPSCYSKTDHHGEKVGWIAETIAIVSMCFSHPSSLKPWCFVII